MTLSPEFLVLQAALKGRYVLERELGRGGMGVVFLAREIALERPVALKLLPPHLADTPALRERFLREARTAARLAHPHIVPIYAVEAERELVWFAMAYVPGQTLAERVREEGPLTPAAAARMMQEVAWALAYAHQQGVVHRDVKPENILIERGTGRALVADFGIARLMEATPVTPHGDLLGTARYTSPEQAAGEDTDGRSDLYSLGVSAFFALTGRPPFDADAPAALLAQHLAVPAPPVASLRAGIPRVLAQTVDRCLAKSPALRFSSGEALAGALTQAGSAATSTTPPVLQRLVRETSSLGVDLAGYGTLASIVLLAQALTAQSDFLGMGQVYSIGIALVLASLTGLKGISAARQARQAVMEGWTSRDLEDAIQDEVRCAEFDGPPRMSLTRATALFVAGFAGCLALWLGPREALMRSLDGPLIFLLELAALGIPVALGRWYGSRLEEPRNGKAGIFSRFATLKAKVLLRLGGVLLRRRPAPALPSAQPTELFLADQALGLFKALPAPQQQRLAEVGATIERLSRDAVRLRARDTELASAIAATGAPDQAARDGVRREFELEREMVAHQLAETLGALDTLRLDLLRLRTGTATPEGLTAALEVVRRVGREVDAVLDVERMGRT